MLKILRTIVHILHKNNRKFHIYVVLNKWCNNEILFKLGCAFCKIIIKYLVLESSN